jgi:hypothetical protein
MALRAGVGRELPGNGEQRSMNRRANRHAEGGHNLRIARSFALRPGPNASRKMGHDERST